MTASVQMLQLSAAMRVSQDMSKFTSVEVSMKGDQRTSGLRVKGLIETVSNDFS